MAIHVLILYLVIVDYRCLFSRNLWKFMSLFSFQDEFNINTWSNRKQNKLASLFQWILFSIYYLNIANDQQNTNQKKIESFQEINLGFVCILRKDSYRAIGFPNYRAVRFSISSIINNKTYQSGKNTVYFIKASQQRFWTRNVFF